MKRSHKSGISFGVASGIVTPLGLLVGLYSGTHSAIVILSGIMTIAIADAFSDALGMHVSKKSDRNYSIREVWEATITTFLSKFCFAIMFLVPFLIFSTRTAVILSVVWGMLFLGGFSYWIALGREESPLWTVCEHVFIGSFVVLITYYLPILIKTLFM